MSDSLDRLAIAFAAVAPHADAAVWLPVLAPPMRSSGITTRCRVAGFLGQCAEETGGFLRLEEDLHYSSSRLTQVWPHRFPTLVDAAPYSQQPERLANKVYADRMGNGDPASGDGWRFRGGGALQLTGRDNYAAFAHDVGMPPDAAAEFVRTPPGAARSACWVWTRMGLNALADEWDLRTMTQRLNGGLTNYDTRVRLCTAALAAIDGGGAPEPETTSDDLNAQVLAGSFHVKQV